MLLGSRNPLGLAYEQTVRVPRQALPSYHLITRGLLSGDCERGDSRLHVALRLIHSHQVAAAQVEFESKI